MNKLEKILFWQKDGPAADNRRLETAHWAVNIAALLIWAAGLNLVSMLLSAGGSEHQYLLFVSYLKRLDLLALNFLPVLLITALAYFISNRAWITVLSSGGLVLVLSIINYLKLRLRGDPLMAADIMYITEAAKIGEGYNLSFDGQMLLTMAGLAVSTVFSAFFLRARIRDKKARLICLPVIIILFAALTVTLYADRGIYNKAANVEENSSFMNKWSDKDQYISRGFIYPLLHSIQSAGEKKPEGYGEKKGEALLSQYAYDDIPADKKVSVITVMLEAYADLTDFGVIDFTEDPYQYLHKLEGESVSGDLLSNVFAGGTINTERCFLTGYDTLYTYRRDTPSYADYFVSQGYTVEGGHPGFAWFYNRQNVMEYFGFENYYFWENRYDTGSYIMEDQAFFADLISLYEANLETGKPYFSFSITYQNHGPYDTDKLYSQTEYATDKGYATETYNILNNYLYGISKTDKAIEEMVEYFRDSDEPVILVFFGDHKPWLGDNSTVYTELGIDISRQSDESLFNYYGVPYVIWANDTAKSALGRDFTGDGGSFSPMFLMNKIFSLAGWGGDEFMKASNALMEITDVVHDLGLYRRDGAITDEPDETLKNALAEFRIIQYYRRRG